MISEDDIRRVREQTDLVALIGERVVLKQRGREFWGCCPFHNEKTPSFKIDPTTQLFHCFGCGEGGDAFGFLMKADGLEFPDAIHVLADRANIEIHEIENKAESGTRARLLDVCEKAAEFYHHQLMRVKNPGSDAARAYFSGRGFGGSTPKDWMLGYAPGRGELVKHLTKLGFTRDEMLGANVAREKDDRRIGDRFFERVIFPIFDVRGRVIAFGGRVIDASNPEAPKYLNSSDTALFHKRENLYAIDRAKASMTATSTALVVEGYTDVIAMHRAGFTNTVATLGTALTPQHVKLLKRYARRIIYLFDGDRAGLEAADKAASLIVNELGAAGFENIDFLVAVLPGDADPADFCANNGAQSMQEVLDKAQPLLRFALDRRLTGVALKTPEQRTRALGEALQVLLPVRGTLLANDYLNYLAGVFKVDFETVRTALDSLKAPRSAYTGQASSSTHGAGLDPSIFSAQERIINLERELLIYAISYPVVRRTLAEAFSRITFKESLHRDITLCMTAEETWIDEAPIDLVTRIIDALPESARLLGAGLAKTSEEEALMHARILMFSLREEQLEREIRVLTSKQRLLEGKEAEEAKALFIEIVSKQRELKEVRKRFAELPKTLG